MEQGEQGANEKTRKWCKSSIMEDQARWEQGSRSLSLGIAGKYQGAML